MKKHPAIVNRVEQYEYKKGIKYKKSDGKLFLTLKILLSVFFAWAIAMNLLAVLSWSLRIGTESFKGIANAFYTLLCCSIFSIIGYVLIFTKIKLIGIAVTIFTSIFTVITYAPLLADATMRFGYKTIYFTRHFIPHTMVVIISLSMLIILITEYFKFNATYKKIEENLYNKFLNNKQTENSDISWEEYLNKI